MKMADEQRENIMQVTRRTLTFGTVAALAAPAIIIPGRSAHAAEFTFKLGLVQPKDHIATQILDKYAAKMGEESKGRIDLRTYPSGQLGGDLDMIMQVKSGALEFQLDSGTMLSNVVPPAGINAVGFAFKDSKQAWQAMDGPLGATIREALDAGGMHCFPTCFEQGFRQLTTSKRKVENVGDVKNLKLRLPIGPVWTSLWSNMGAAPTSIDITELYTALQTGVVEGAEGPLQQIETFKLYEVQKFIAMTNHMWDNWWVFTNKAMWQKLPADLQEIMARNFEAAAQEERAAILADNQHTADLLKSQGVTFTDPDIASFRDKLKSTSYYKDWSAKYGPKVWGALEQVVGKLT
jgi:tripartite ATP-independent transporter DctP family solute receptor